MASDESVAYMSSYLRIFLSIHLDLFCYVTWSVGNWLQTEERSGSVKIKEDHVLLRPSHHPYVAPLVLPDLNQMVTFPGLSKTRRLAGVSTENKGPACVINRVQALVSRTNLKDGDNDAGRVKAPSVAPVAAVAEFEFVLRVISKHTNTLIPTEECPKCCVLQLKSASQD